MKLPACPSRVHDDSGPGPSVIAVHDVYLEPSQRKVTSSTLDDLADRWQPPIAIGLVESLVDSLSTRMSLLGVSAMKLGTAGESAVVRARLAAQRALTRSLFLALAGGRPVFLARLLHAR